MQKKPFPRKKREKKTPNPIPKKTFGYHYLAIASLSNYIPQLKTLLFLSNHIPQLKTPWLVGCPSTLPFMHISMDQIILSWKEAATHDGFVVFLLFLGDWWAFFLFGVWGFLCSTFSFFVRSVYSFYPVSFFNRFNHLKIKIKKDTIVSYLWVSQPNRLTAQLELKTFVHILE